MLHVYRHLIVRRCKYLTILNSQLMSSFAEADEEIIEDSGSATSGPISWPGHRRVARREGSDAAICSILACCLSPVTSGVIPAVRADSVGRVSGSSP